MSQGQTRLRKNFRIIDHIYTLFSLIKKYIKKGQYLCTRFDFTWREGLMHKLEKREITG